MKNTVKKNKTIFDHWPEWKDKELFSFFGLLNLTEIDQEIRRLEDSNRASRNPLFGVGGPTKFYPPEEIAQYKSLLLSRHLSKIEEHKLFKLLSKHEDFQGIYNWIGSNTAKKEFKGAPPETRIAFIKAVAHAITVLSERKRGRGRDEKLSIKDGEKIQKAAQELRTLLQKSSHIEWPFSSACDYIEKPLDYIIGYEFTKPENEGATQFERIILREFVGMFVLFRLPIMPHVFRGLLNMCGMPGRTSRRFSGQVSNFKAEAKQLHNKALSWVIENPATKNG